MTNRNSRPRLVERRGELLAELLLQELEPEFLSRAASPDLGYHFLTGFANREKGINTFGVKLKATERPVPSRFPLDWKSFVRLTRSNIPILLLVVDVKRNELFYAWLRPELQAEKTRLSVSVPVVKVDDVTKQKLSEQVRSAGPPAPAVAVG